MYAAQWGRGKKIRFFAKVIMDKLFITVCDKNRLSAIDNPCIIMAVIRHMLHAPVTVCLCRVGPTCMSACLCLCLSLSLDLSFVAHVCAI